MKPIDHMTGLEKAAALLIALGADAASRVLKYLDEDSIRKIVTEIAKIEELSTEEKEEMMGEFLLNFRKNKGAIFGGENEARNLLVSAFGKSKAEEIFNKLTRRDLENGFDFLKNIDSEILASFLESEHLQTITVTLAFLPSHKSAKILNKLPPYIGKEVSKRMAKLGNISPDAVLEIVRFLKKKYEKHKESIEKSQGTDGVNILIDIINRMSFDDERKLLDYFDISIPDISDKIKNRIYTFDNVLILSHLEIQALIDNLNNDHLIAKAIKGAGDNIRIKFLKNMSRNRATDILSESFNMGPTRMGEIKEARDTIVSTMKRLNENGIITLRKDEMEEDEYID